MDNKFTQFVEMYKDEITALFEALKNFFIALYEKFNAEDAE